jgi:hypothetical protein
MKVAVIGSRDFNDYELMSEHLNQIKDEIQLIVSGGAKGADSLAEKWASENSIETLIFKPDWKKFGRSAGVVRNRDIVANSNLVIAFWDGQSKGTKSSIDLCGKLGIKVKIVRYK